MTGLLGGEIQFIFVTPPSGLPLIKAGRIRALAYNHTTRAPFLPDTPTMAEAGGPRSEMSASWHGLFAPASTPPHLLAVIEKEVRKALAVPEVRDRFLREGVNPVGDSSSEFRTFVTAEITRLGEIVRLAGIEPESAPGR